MPAGADTNPGATPFGNPQNAFANDASYATGQNSYAEVYYGFGFSIGSGSTINGIVVTVVANAGTCAGIANKQFRVYVSNDGLTFSAPSGGGGSTGALGATDGAYSFGSSTNLWGLGWTVSPGKRHLRPASGSMLRWREHRRPGPESELPECNHMLRDDLDRNIKFRYLLEPVWSFCVGRAVRSSI